MLGLGTIQRTLDVFARAVGKIPAVDEKFKIRARLFGPFPNGPAIWMHGASLGECKMLLSLARILKADVPEIPRVVLTTQKAEVLDFLNPQAEALGISMGMAPLDSPRALRLFMREVNPRMLILAENELWPGYLEAFRKRFRTPRVALVSGRFYRCLTSRNFDAIGFACMQTGADVDRFVAAGDDLVPQKTIVGGDWKLLPFAKSDGEVRPPRNPTVDFAFLSFHLEERRPLLKMLRAAIERGCAVVFAARFDADSVRLERLFSRNGLLTLKWPQVRKGCVSVVDGYGKLPAVLGVSRVAVIGGSFARTLGVHDFWEPLKMGVTTCIGPFARGQDAVVSSLVRDGALVQLRRPDELGKVRTARADAAGRFLAYEREKALAAYKAFVEYVRQTLNPETFQ